MNRLIQKVIKSITPPPRKQSISVTEPAKLHLGSGPYRFDGWINIDIDSPKADVRMDLREKLPFASGTARYVFAEHFIEHVTRSEAIALLKECNRVLDERGIIRLSTPDLRKMVDLYLGGELTYWKEVSWLPATPCQMVNEGMRSWGHQFVYDKDELCAVLIEAGLSAHRFVEWRHSEIPQLRGLERRPFHSELIVEAARDQKSFE